METYLRQMIESSARMSLETLRIQHQLQVAALAQQIRALEQQLQHLERSA